MLWTNDRALVLLSANCSVNIIDSDCMVQVVQLFYNDTTKYIQNASYYFAIEPLSVITKFEATISSNAITADAPLPVDHQCRIVKGVIQEAKNLHSEFRISPTRAKKSSSPVFKMDVGGVNENEMVQILLEYVISLKSDEDDSLRLNIPITVMPNFDRNMAASLLGSDLAGFKMDLRVVMASPILEIKSNAYGITWKHEEGCVNNTIATGVLEGGERLQRLVGDISMIIRFASSDIPRVFAEYDPVERSYALALTVNPKFQDMYKREIIIVVDRSKWMEGWRMAVAKEATQFLLKSLPSNSYFNIVGFGSFCEYVFPKSMPINPETMRRACDYIKCMGANMNVPDMLEAILVATEFVPVEGFKRQIFVISEGVTRDTREIIATIHRNAGHTRFFSVGFSESNCVGLLESIARAGRGSCCLISEGERVQSRIVVQLQEALNSSLTEVSVDWSTAEEICTPSTTAATTTTGYAKKLTVFLGFDNDGDILKYPAVSPPLFSGCLYVFRALVKRDVKLPTKVVFRAATPDHRHMEYSLRIDQTTAQSTTNTRMLLHKQAVNCLIQDLQDSSLTLENCSTEKSMLDIVALSLKYSVPSKHTAFFTKGNGLNPTDNSGYDANLKISDIRKLISRQVSFTTDCKHQLLTPRSAASSKCSEREEETLSKLINLQEYDGSFCNSAEFCNLVGIDANNIRISASKNNNVSLDVWTTAIAVAFIRGSLPRVESDWSLVEKKAFRFVAANCDARAAVELVDKATSTFPQLVVKDPLVF